MDEPAGLLYNPLAMSSGLSFLHCGRFPDCRAEVFKHFDGYCSLQLMNSGGVDLTYDRRTYALVGSWVWAAFPGPLIRFRAGSGHPCWSHRYVAASGPQVMRWLAEGLWPSSPQAAPEPGWVNRFDEMIDLAARTDAWSIRRAANTLERVLIDLAEARTRTDAKAPWLAETLDRLDRDAASCGPAVDYAAIAAAGGCGLSTLRRKFRQATGLSLHQYVLQSKVQAARDLLGSTDMTIKAIADRLGYADVYFFTRQFKSHSDVPPAMYRRSRQVG